MEAPTVDHLRREWSQVEAAFRSYVMNLVDRDLDEVRRYASRNSTQEFTNPLWVMLFQAANHAMQHRTEIAYHLAGLGRSTGNLDFVIYHADLTNAMGSETCGT